MDFRRSGQRDERRRRVLLEETGGGGVGSESSQEASHEGAVAGHGMEPVRCYSEAALSPRQPRVIDLIPKRPWTNLVLLLGLASMTVGLEAAYGHLALRQLPAEVSRFPAIDLAGTRGVATWLRAAMLAACAVLGVLTYQIRRYRTDDYRGRYRMWYWMVLVLVLASVDAVAGLLASLRTGLFEMTVLAEYADPQLIWLALLAVVVGLIGVRLAIEMWASRIAVFSLTIALACLAAVATMRLGWLLPGDDLFATMVRSGLLLAGHIAILMAFCLNARHVYREASGVVSARPVRRPKTPARASRRSRSEAKEPASPVATGRQVTRRLKGKILRQDPPHVAPDPAAPDPAAPAPLAPDKKAASAPEVQPKVASGQPAVRKEKKAAAEDRADQGRPGSKGLCTFDDDQVEDSSRLSKAERKRLRKHRRTDHP